VFDDGAAAGVDRGPPDDVGGLSHLSDTAAAEVHQGQDRAHPVVGPDQDPTVERARGETLRIQYEDPALPRRVTQGETLAD
jgi:hypothetical protein